MKRLLPLFLCVLAIAACKKDNNPGEDEKKVDATRVSVNATITGLQWKTGDAIAVTSSCSRGEESGVSMSKNAVAKLVANKEGEMSSFAPASDNDAILTEDGDRSFKFYAAYPWVDGLTDLKSYPLAAAAQQNYSADPKANLPFVASASVLNVLAPVNFTMSTPYVLISFRIPKDIIAGQKNTLRSLTLSGEGVELSEQGTYNVITASYTAGDKAASVKLNFGEGLTLEEDKTTVSFVVAPFTVPEGGLTLEVETTAATSTLNIFTTEGGRELVAGQVIEWNLSNMGDSVEPVDFPVVFLLGLDDDGAGYCNADLQPTWKTSESADGRWLSTQPQAFAQWNWGPRFEGETLVPYIEFVNSGKISSPGVKGIWSGDNLEINIPVKNFAAGTTLNIDFPFYGRQHPMFWDIEYLDGIEWKCNRKELSSVRPAKDETGQHPDMAGKPITCEATFHSNLGSNHISENITFANAVADGWLKIRIVSVHAEYQNGGANATNDFIRSAPYTSSGKYGAPFYFFCADVADTDIDESKLDLVISFAN